MDEIYARSPMTETWYRVTEYEERGENGKIVAKQKEEVDREEVPEEWQKAILNNMGDVGI